MLLCALAPCSLFRHTMATLVAPFISFLCAPSSGGCLCCPCSSVCQHPGLSPPPPPPAPCSHGPPAPFSPQPTMSDRSTPSRDTPSPAPDTSRGGAIRRGPFPMFLMEIAQSDDADRLLRELDMLKDDALEAADTAIRATDPALADSCDALRWTAADGDIQAITAMTGRGRHRDSCSQPPLRSLQARLTRRSSNTSPCCWSMYPRTLRPSQQHSSRDGVQAMFRSQRHAFAAKSSKACTRPENILRPSTLPLLQTSKAKKSPTRFTSPSASS